MQGTTYLLADVRMLQVTIVIDEGGLPKYATRYHYLSPMYCRLGGTFSNQVGSRGQACGLCDGYNLPPEIYVHIECSEQFK